MYPPIELIAQLPAGTLVDGKVVTGNREKIVGKTIISYSFHNNNTTLKVTAVRPSIFEGDALSILEDVGVISDRMQWNIDSSQSIYGEDVAGQIAGEFFTGDTEVYHRGFLTV